MYIPTWLSTFPSREDGLHVLPPRTWQLIVLGLVTEFTFSQAEIKSLCEDSTLHADILRENHPNIAVECSAFLLRTGEGLGSDLGPATYHD